MLEGLPVFLADHSRGYGRQARTLQMHPSSIHRRIQKILGHCDISGERASPQTLRNTYAAILIDTGASDHELVDFMGLQASISAQRLRVELRVIQDGQGNPNDYKGQSRLTTVNLQVKFFC